VLGVALVLIASSPPKIVTPRDVFGLARRGTRAAGKRPAIERYPARDARSSPIASTTPQASG